MYHLRLISSSCSGTCPPKILGQNSVSRSQAVHEICKQRLFLWGRCMCPVKVNGNCRGIFLTEELKPHFIKLFNQEIWSLAITQIYWNLGFSLISRNSKKVAKCWGWIGRNRSGCKVVCLYILGALLLNCTHLWPFLKLCDIEASQICPVWTAVCWTCSSWEELLKPGIWLNFLVKEMTPDTVE